MPAEQRDYKKSSFLDIRQACQFRHFRGLGALPPAISDSFGIIGYLGSKMPVENGRAEVEKRSSAGNANQASSAAPGKKRKKKKKEKCGESANGGAKIVLRGGEKLGEVPPKETGAGK